MENEGDNCKCKWSNDCMKDAASNMKILKKMEFKSFVIGAIPEDKKITISWNENLPESDVDGYILYIPKK